MSEQLSPITADNVDADAAKVVFRLQRHGYQAFMVGGCVRDLLLGRSPKDFDVATNATPTEIRKLFRNCRIIGRRFRLAHIFFGSKIIETSTFRAAPSAEEEPTDDADRMIWRDNVFGTAEEDALRRDFTINALFYDPKARRVIDTVGGLDDLRARLVRTIGDPDVRLPEDPIRILRAVKFAARLDLTIEQRTQTAMIEHRGLIARCAVARVLEEIYRLLQGANSRTAFEMLHEHGVLAVLLPELAALLAPPRDARAQGPVPAIRPGQRHRPRTDDDGEDPELADDKPPELDPEQDRREVEDLLHDIGLVDAETRQRAAGLLWPHLEALDDLVRRAEDQPGHALLLAAPFCALIDHLLAGEERLTAIADGVDLVIKQIGMRIQISRRDKDHLRQVLTAQRRLTHGRPRQQITQRDYFRDALQLLELRHTAGGGFEAQLASWRDALGHTGGRRRKRRRRRPRTNSPA